MPIYEYRCGECAGLTSLFVRSLRGDRADPACEHCGSRRLARRISAVARLRTGQDAIGEYGAPGPGGDPAARYRDPRQIGRWVEQRFEQYGIDLPGETREMIDAAREGELPGPAQDA